MSYYKDNHIYLFILLFWIQNNMATIFCLNISFFIDLASKTNQVVKISRRKKYKYL